MNDKILSLPLFLGVDCFDFWDPSITNPTVMTVNAITTHNIKSTNFTNLKLLLFIFGIFLICNNIFFKLFWGHIKYDFLLKYWNSLISVKYIDLKKEITISRKLIFLGKEMLLGFIVYPLILFNIWLVTITIFWIIRFTVELR
jgi:hypothetical protein